MLQNNAKQVPENTPDCIGFRDFILSVHKALYWFTQG